MTIFQDQLGQEIRQLIDESQAGYSLPQAFYNDEIVYKFDLDAIFNSQWILVDHASRIPKPGDYFLFEIGEESIIILRDQDESVRAFFNVCRHRGSRVCLDKEGNKRFLTCPYHAWAYNLDGSLKVARSMSEHFDPAEHALNSVHVRTLEGLIFINLAKDEPEAFDELYGEYRPIMQFHGFANAKIAHKAQYPTSANWKLVVENFIECYHCAPAHPEYCQVHPADQLLAWGAGPGSGPESAEESYEKSLEAWNDKLQALGHENVLITSGEDSFAFKQGSRFPINHSGAESETLDGGPACRKLMGRYAQYDGGETALSYNPFSYVLAFNDFAVMFRWTPRGVCSTDVELTWLVDRSAEEEVDYTIDRLTKVWDITVQQDKTITQNNQLGINSARYQPGPYSEHERLVVTFTRWYLERLKANISSAAVEA